MTTKTIDDQGKKEIFPTAREDRLTLKTDQAVIMMIKDQGVGMDRETLENVYIPFFSKKAQSTGLGMAIAKKVVETTGGRFPSGASRSAGRKSALNFPGSEIAGPGSS